MSQLEEYRDQIDAVDRELVELFRRRMDITAKVGQYKLERQMPAASSGGWSTREQRTRVTLPGSPTCPVPVRRWPIPEWFIRESRDVTARRPLWASSAPR